MNTCASVKKFCKFASTGGQCIRSMPYRKPCPETNVPAVKKLKWTHVEARQIGKVTKIEEHRGGLRVVYDFTGRPRYAN